MNEENKIKTIAISQETFDKLSDETINRIKESVLERFKEIKGVELVILPREEIFDRYIENKKSQDTHVVVLLDDKDEKERFEKRQEELINKIMEFKMPPHLPEILDAKYIYQEQRKQEKPYVPRTIGRPNSKKKGGR